MDIRHLECYRTVYTTMSYAKAAEELCLSRQAVRSTVKSLEQELGRPLFSITTNGRLAPTEFGEWLAQRAKPVLASFSAFDRDVHEHLQNAAEMPAVGFSYEMLDTLEPEVFASLNDSYSRLFDEPISSGPDFRQGTDREVLSFLHARLIDFACVLANESDVEEFERHLHRTRPLWCLLPKNHPLASKGAIEVTDLRNATLMLRPKGNFVRDTLENACHLTGFEPRIEETTSFDRTSMMRLRARGLISYVLEPQQGISVDGLIALPFTDTSLTWSHWSLRRHDAPNTYTNRLYWKQCTKATFDDA